jgi:AcrR family transcriptional regulator
MRRPGRPRGESGSKEAILAAARALFAEVGYEQASIRAIARRAEVDPALVHHYFGTKDELLIAAVHLPIDAATIIAAAFEDREHLGNTLIRSILTLWDRPEIRDRVIALIRGAVANPNVLAIMRSVVAREVVQPLAQRIDLPHPELRAELAATHLIGLAMGRYIARIEPLASTPADQLAAAIGPTLHRYLTDPALLKQ